MKGVRCAGSGAFPTNFDGESTYCDTCGRSLRLARDGRVPSHKTRAAKTTLLPRGEAWIDGRRTGDAHNPGPAQ